MEAPPERADPAGELLRYEVDSRGPLSRVRFVGRGQTVHLTAHETAGAAVPAKEGSS